MMELLLNKAQVEVLFISPDIRQGGNAAHRGIRAASCA